MWSVISTSGRQVRDSFCPVLARSLWPRSSPPTPPYWDDTSVLGMQTFTTIWTRSVIEGSFVHSGVRLFILTLTLTLTLTLPSLGDPPTVGVWTKQVTWQINGLWDLKGTQREGKVDGKKVMLYLFFSLSLRWIGTKTNPLITLTQTLKPRF